MQFSVPNCQLDSSDVLLLDSLCWVHALGRFLYRS